MSHMNNQSFLEYDYAQPLVSVEVFLLRLPPKDHPMVKTMA